MIVTGPARDGTRLGLIDVGVPRCICWRLVRTTGLLFLLKTMRWDGKTCRSKDRRYKTFCWLAAIEMGPSSGGMRLVT
jgi:hypothetical protein